MICFIQYLNIIFAVQNSFKIELLIRIGILGVLMPVLCIVTTTARLELCLGVNEVLYGSKGHIKGCRARAALHFTTLL